MVWKSKGDEEKRKFDFTYDAVNRLSAGDFNQYTAGAFNTSANVDFSVEGLTYDANGNILGMSQKGLQFNGSHYIDKLTYDYPLYSNKLARVTNAVNDKDSNLGDFKYDPDGKGIDYTYDNER